jgi:phosphatidylserine/phosphatidylglycerophosphate/cardiolipin synthase-like enzyme
MQKYRIHFQGLYKLVILFLTLLFTTLACQTATHTQIPSVPTEPLETELWDSNEDWYTLYFTQPDDPSSSSLRGGPDRDLADAIRNARASVDVASHKLDLWSLRDALIDAHRQGITVRLVVESDYLDEPEVQELIAAGIPVLGDRREGLMHNKFVIIDRQEVWTGSMNFTINGAYHSNNNLVRVHSSELAENYLVEFNEMFIDDYFGPGSPANTPHPSFNQHGIQLETYFAPDDRTSARLQELIRTAQHSIYFLAFSFTSDDLASALIDRHQAGVEIAGVFDDAQYQSNTGTEFDNLKQSGIDVRQDGRRYNMHHKVIIIDERIVVTGSYNFSRSAEERNDENTLIIHSPEIAAYFLEEFNRIYSQALP